MPIPRNLMPRATNKEPFLQFFAFFDRRRFLRRFFLRIFEKNAEKSCGFGGQMDYYR